MHLDYKTPFGARSLLPRAALIGNFRVGRHDEISAHLFLCVSDRLFDRHHRQPSDDFDRCE